VVDKDRAAAILARELKAALLLILTDVPAVYRDYGTDRATPIARLTAAQAQSLLDTGQCGQGSMRPKVEAAIAFAKTGGRAIIAELSEGLAAIRGTTGTSIVAEG
jgi:carbamate kinase